MIKRFEHLFIQINKALIGLMMGVMFILVFVNVVGRYCFGHSFAITEEVSTFLMIWITYLGIGLALREGRHASIDLFQDMLPEKAKRPFRAMLGFVILIFFILLGYYGVKFAVFGWSQEAAMTQIPKGIPYLAVPIGALIFVVHLALIFRNWIDKEREESQLTDESDGLGGEMP
jgi:TRAP-type C4-dicarboxylate transport system permease small subunit